MIPPKNCSGCGACVHICPVHAIGFEKDREGYYYPIINQNECIGCGACEMLCPTLRPRKPESVHPVAYASQNRDEQVRDRSSSGGVFSLLAEHVIRCGGMVIGCAMTKDCYAAEHKVITDEQGLDQLRGSKYLQSRADHVYPIIKKALKDGRQVLFSGTPCQVVGLQAYLGDIEEKPLITVDVICHGAPSPAVWEKYVRHWETVKQSKVVSVQFRNKEKGWRPYLLVLAFENGEVYQTLCTEDLYCRGFVSDYFLRRSCYDCSVKGEYHGADITLGDLWGVQHVCASMDDNRGTSLVLLNTSKGENLFRAIKCDLNSQQVDFNGAIKYNPSYHRSSSRKVNRDSFMKKIHKKPIMDLLNTYCGKRLVSRIKRKFIISVATLFAKDRR